MKISNYKFGKITIDSTLYQQDLIITPNNIIENWRREKGHNLILSDFSDFLNINELEKVVIGAGALGMMKVSSEVIRFFQENNIDYYILKTGKAVEKFNSIAQENKIAMLHLTC